MPLSALRRLFPTPTERTRKAYGQQVARVNEFAHDVQKLANSQLRARARQHLQSARDRGVAEAHELAVSLALAREAAYRALGQRAYDVQVMAALALLDGRIAEMRTGEGKTLAAVLAAYAAALTQPGVHLVTANEYLAKRDAAAMGQVFEFLGMSTGATLPGMPPEQKRAAYSCDVVYGPSTEFAIDYLHDNLVGRAEDRLQRESAFVIIDEVDAVLIDSARRPVTLNGPAEGSTDLVQRLAELPSQLARQADPKAEGDYWVDEAAQGVVLSEQGYDALERILATSGLLPEGSSLFAGENTGLVFAVNATLRAHSLFQRDRHYVVQDGAVVLVNEMTGRAMPGSRLEEGLHQALEAKEGVPVQLASQPYATISLQNYFRRYQKLAGMTGTAETEAIEFKQVYGREVSIIPTRRPSVRQDHDDLIYMTAADKWSAVLREIKERHGWGQPILVGTGSIEDNERLSAMLAAEGLPHQVLNAQNHAREAQVIAMAGAPGAITLAAGMAGRGTDIILGGDLEGQLATLRANPELSEAEKVGMAEALSREWALLRDQAVAAGGLYVLGTERYESRRVDNQLRGRAGRQGDPGESRFYLSLEDPLLSAFPSEAIQRMATNLRIPAGEALEHRWVSKAIAAAQRQMEARSYNARKQILEFDNVIAAQRQVIYAQRDTVLAAADVAGTVTSMRRAALHALFDAFIPEGSHEADWDITGAERALADEYELRIPIQQMLAEDPQLERDVLRARVMAAADDAFLAKESAIGEANMRMFEKMALLQVLDRHWRAQLASLEHLQHGIHLRGYANKDPKQEYKREAFGLFERMLHSVGSKVARAVYTVETRPRGAV